MHAGKSELLRLPYGDHNTILGANVPVYLTALVEFFLELGIQPLSS